MSQSDGNQKVWDRAGFETALKPQESYQVEKGSTRIQSPLETPPKHQSVCQFLGHSSDTSTEFLSSNWWNLISYIQSNKCIFNVTQHGLVSSSRQLSVWSTCECALTMNYSSVWEDGWRQPQAVKERAGRYVGGGDTDGKKKPVENISEGLVENQTSLWHTSVSSVGEYTC